jgi:hypothetical protein
MPTPRKPSAAASTAGSGDKWEVPSASRRPRPTVNRGGGKSGVPRPAATDPPPRSTVAEKRDETLEKDIVGLYMTAGMVAMMFNKDLGASIATHSENVAAAWMEVAQRNPKVRKSLVDITAASIWGGIFAAHVQMFAPVLSGVMGALPMPKPNTPAPPTPPVRFDPTLEAQLNFLREADPAAYALAMKELGRDHSTGGPGDTVRVPGPAGTVTVPPNNNSTGPVSHSSIQIPDLSKPEL